MVSSKLFLNNTTQAVRLPKEVAFPEGVTEVEIFVEGDTRVIVPKGQSLIAWISQMIAPRKRFAQMAQRLQKLLPSSALTSA